MLVCESKAVVPTAALALLRPEEPEGSEPVAGTARAPIPKVERARMTALYIVVLLFCIVCG